MSDVSGNDHFNDHEDEQTEINEESEVETNENEQSYATVVVDTPDYTQYFENIQTVTILILAVLIAIGCIIGWVGARRE